MGDFERDDAWQRRIRDEVLGPGFYGPVAAEGRFVFLDRGDLAEALQRQCAVDTILQSRDGRAVTVEEKIVRWPGYAYSAFTLETDSCTKQGREKQGWMHYGTADILLYAFTLPDETLDVCLMDFARLKAWFWPQVERFDQFGPLRTLNASAGRKVPVAECERDLPFWRVRASTTAYRTTFRSPHAFTVAGFAPSAPFLPTDRMAA